MRSGTHIIRIIALLTMFAAADVRPALAEVTITGAREAITVIASNVTVGELLKRVADTYHIELHDEDGLTAPVTGTYSGELGDIIAQILGSTNYMMRSIAGKKALFVLSPPTKADVIADPQWPKPAVVTSSTGRPQLTLAPVSQDIALRAVGNKGGTLQVDNALPNAFRSGRGGHPYLGAPPPATPAPQQ